MSDISPILRGCSTNLTGWHLLEDIAGFERCRCGWRPTAAQGAVLAKFAEEVSRRDQQSAERLARKRVAPPRMEI